MQRTAKVSTNKHTTYKKERILPYTTCKIFNKPITISGNRQVGWCRVKQLKKEHKELLQSNVPTSLSIIKTSRKGKRKNINTSVSQQARNREHLFP